MLAVINVICYLVNALFLVASIVLNRREKARLALLREEEKYLGEVVKEYARSDNLLSATIDGSNETDSQMKSEALRLTRVLENDAQSDEADHYMRTAANSYMALFFTLCNMIRSYGDLKINGVSVFAHNVRYIKEEIRAEILRRQDGHYQFLGLDGLCIIPFFFMIPLELWAGSVGEGMSSYYSGTYGFMTLMLCFFMAIGSLTIVWFLQYEKRTGIGNKNIYQKLLDVRAIGLITEWLINRRYSFYLKLNEKLKRLSDGGNVREFIVRKYFGMLIGLISGSVFMVLFIAINGSANPGVFLSVIAGTGLLFFFGPDLWLVVLNDSVSGKKMEETLRYETLILIAMHYEQVTVEEILRWMEHFSVVFKNSIERAVDDFSYMRGEVLERLRDDIAYEPAGRLIDGLLACDDIPLEKAFYDLEGERAYDMDQYVKQCASRQRERAAVARVIAFLPFVTMLAFRLVVPFVAEGLTRMNGMG